MSFPAKVDGFGTRLDTSTGRFDAVNHMDRPKFVRMFASAPISKGDAVCFDFTVSTNGLGNNVTKCAVGAAATKQAIGIAAADIAEDDIGLIQIQGLCTFADIDDTADDPGALLAAGATAGRLTLDVVAALPVAILVTEGTAGSKNSTVYLLNPANL